MVYYAVGSKVPIPPTLTYALFFCFQKETTEGNKVQFYFNKTRGCGHIIG
jgi:hypothetical protein